MPPTAPVPRVPVTPYAPVPCRLPDTVTGRGAAAGGRPGVTTRPERLRPRRASPYRVAHALRAWALADPQRYFLVFGTPVPGYHAPDGITAIASETMATLLAACAELPPDGAATPCPWNWPATSPAWASTRRASSPPNSTP